MNGFLALLTLACTAAIIGATSKPHPPLRPCPPAPRGVNAIVRVTTSGNNAWAKYTCRRGFVRVGGRTQLDCKNGRYTSRDALRCGPKPRPCPRAPRGVNALVSVTSTGVGSARATYRCRPGFVRSSGSTVLVCRGGRYTSTSALRCKRRPKPCPRAPRGVNASVSVSSTGVGSARAAYRCRPGFVRSSGSTVLVCRGGRYTSTNALRCRRKVRPCPRAPRGVNATVQVKTSGNNAWATYKCKRGFVRRSGKTQLECLNGKYTSTDALKCRRGGGYY